MPKIEIKIETEQTVNIAQVELQTKSLSKQKEFYSNVLNLDTLHSNDILRVNIGSSRLIFKETPSIETPSKETLSIENPYYHFAINIPENQIDSAVKWLKQRVELIEYENSPVINFPNWNAHSVYFYDSCGNIVELIARHNLDNKTGKDFSQSSFINISEIGIPVENVKDFHGRLKQSMNEKLWWGNLETFAAIGGESGLFIVVTTQRNWFPTDKPCKAFPLSITLNSGGKSLLEYSDYLIKY